MEFRLKSPSDFGAHLVRPALGVPQLPVNEHLHLGLLCLLGQQVLRRRVCPCLLGGRLRRRCTLVKGLRGGLSSFGFGAPRSAVRRPSLCGRSMVAQPGGKLEADDDEIEEGDEGDRAEHHPEGIIDASMIPWPSELQHST